MRIQVLDEADDDLEAGRDFYERQAAGVGEYFAVSIAADIESLILFAGIHSQEFGYYRLLSKRFPFGIYYRIDQSIIRIYAVLDLRRDPASIRKRLTGR